MGALSSRPAVQARARSGAALLPLTPGVSGTTTGQRAGVAGLTETQWPTWALLLG